jgi:4-amino-4-deoxy-L-arabinose transferase-like glycosyltransferase
MTTAAGTIGSTAMMAGSGRRIRGWVVLSLLAIGALLGSIDLWHPIDGRSRELWREADVASVARNFARDDMRILYPQIDWRGNGPGYVEMEFPVYPYMIALGYRMFGFHEVIGRLLSFAFFLAAILVFVRLAEWTLPVPGAIAATAFFVVNPLAYRVANAIQPEGLMFLAYVAAVYCFIRWLDDDRWWWYGWALAWTILAILAKSPAAHLGIVFVFLILYKQGWAPFRRLRLWVFAVAALLPNVLWYAHARSFWIIYGNSLGASNVKHWVGLELFYNPHFFEGIGSLEVQFAWNAAGLLAVLLAVALAPAELRKRRFGVAAVWYAAVLVYYLVVARSVSRHWATYYHIVSLAPVALLFGAAASVGWDRFMSTSRLDQRKVMTAAMLALPAVGILALAAQFGSGRFALLVLAVAAVGIILLPSPVRYRLSEIASTTTGPWAVAATGLLGVSILSAPLLSLQHTLRETGYNDAVPLYEAALKFRPLIAPGALMIASGSACPDSENGSYQIAEFFYWLDRYGFSICQAQHTLPAVEAFRQQGARYLVVERHRDITGAPTFESDMRSHFRLLAETPAVMLFQLDAPPPAADASRPAVVSGLLETGHGTTGQLLLPVRAAPTHLPRELRLE